MRDESYTYIREERLATLLGSIVQQVEISEQVGQWIRLLVVGLK